MFLTRKIRNDHGKSYRHNHFLSQGMPFAIWNILHHLWNVVQNNYDLWRLKENINSIHDDKHI